MGAQEGTNQPSNRRAMGGKAAPEAPWETRVIPAQNPIGAMENKEKQSKISIAQHPEAPWETKEAKRSKAQVKTCFRPQTCPPGPHTRYQSPVSPRRNFCLDECASPMSIMQSPPDGVTGLANLWSETISMFINLQKTSKTIANTPCSKNAKATPKLGLIKRINPAAILRFARAYTTPQHLWCGRIFHPFSPSNFSVRGFA